MAENKNIEQVKNNQDEEITLKDVIIQAQLLVSDIRGYWWQLLIITGLLIGGFIIQALFTPVVYSSKLTFMLNENDDSSGGASGLLGQIGFGSIGGAGINVNKMIELSKSRKILSETLFSSIKVKQKEDFIANHIIREYDFHKLWKNNPKLNNFYFQHGNIDTFNRVENSALKAIHGKFIRVEEGLMELTSEEKTGILTLLINTTNEDLSYHSTLVFFENLINYYTNKTINKQQASYDKIKQKTDSLEVVLDNKQLELLKFDDENRALGLNQYQLSKIKLQGMIQKLNLVYAESYKQLRIAELALQNKTPFISTIDEPVYPLRKLRASKLLAGLTGGAIAIFLILGFFVGKRMYHNAIH